MMKHFKRNITALGLSLAMVGFAFPAVAEDAADVQARLDAEYQAGNIDPVAHDDLTDLLATAETAEASATEGYGDLLNVMVDMAVETEAVVQESAN